jgi:hypothetical protein
MCASSRNRLKHRQPVEKIVDDKDAESQYTITASSREYFGTVPPFLNLYF